MKKINGFIEFDRKSCIRNNLMSLITFVIILISLLLLDYLSVVNYKPRNNNGMADLAIIAMFLFLSIIVMIVITIVIPLFMKIYKEFNNNLKSLLTLWACNLLISIFLFKVFNNYRIPLTYLLSTIFGSLASLAFKYLNIKRKNKE